jgi:hypothetical protein
MKTTLNLDDDLLREAKKRAAEEGITLTRLFDEALRGRLGTRGAPARREVRWIVVDGGPPRVDVGDREGLYAFLERAD